MDVQIQLNSLEKIARGLELGEEVTWQRIKDAAVEDRVIVMGNGQGGFGEKILWAVGGMKRGPVAWHDVERIALLAQSTGARHINMPLIPNITLANVLGYLLNGLESKSQENLMKLFRVVSCDAEALVLGSDTLYPTLYDFEDSTGESFWARPVENIWIEDFRLLMSKFLQSCGLSPKIVEDVLQQVPDGEMTLEKGLCFFSNGVLEYLLSKMYGIQVVIDTSTMDGCRYQTANGHVVEQRISEEINLGRDPKKASWYNNFLNGAKKLLETRVNLILDEFFRGGPAVATEIVQRIWVELMERNPHAMKYLTFDREQFLKALIETCTQTYEFDLAGSFESTIVAREVDLGQVLINASSEAVSSAFAQEFSNGSRNFKYTTGRDAFVGILLQAASDPERNAVALQNLKGRAETGLALLSISQVTAERGPVLVTEMADPDEHKYKKSIVFAIRELQLLTES